MGVYFATAGDYLKIGYSKKPTSRVGSITRVGTRPDDVPFNSRANLLGWIPGDHWTEVAMHARFAANRVVGEWFRGVDLDEIRELIWQDPCGVDMYRMSALAVYAAIENPEMTRADFEAAGLVVEAPPFDVVRARADFLFSGGVPEFPVVDAADAGGAAW